MTPTEQDKELSEKLRVMIRGYLRHYTDSARDSSVYANEVLSLITADRKRVALESEMNAWKQVRKSCPKKQTLQGNAVSKLTLADVDRKITELKAEQEEV